MFRTLNGSKNLSPRHSYSQEYENMIISLIDKYPGLGLRELARELSSSPQSLKYYTDKLVESKQIIIKRDGKYSRFYNKNVIIEEHEEQIINCIRKGPLLNVIMVFLSESKQEKKELLKNQELVSILDVQPGTVTYYLNQLIECNIVEKQLEGFRLLNPSLIERFIKKYSPTRSIIDNFIELWSSYFQ